jgi:hypothetical protein
VHGYVLFRRQNSCRWHAQGQYAPSHAYRSTRPANASDNNNKPARRPGVAQPCHLGGPSGHGCKMLMANIPGARAAPAFVAPSSGIVSRAAWSLAQHDASAASRPRGCPFFAAEVDGCDRKDLTIDRDAGIRVPRMHHSIRPHRRPLGFAKARRTFPTSFWSRWLLSYTMTKC